MLSVYKDRGIIKWSAFDALNGFNSMLKEMKYRLGKQKKPILSDDDYEIMNRKLKQSIIESKEISITYYESGYSKISFGRIKKLDFENKLIILTTLEKISAFDVLEIEIL